MNEKAHVLIVDDHRDIRDLVGKYLGQHGFRVSTASGGEEARRMLRAGSFDLVVLDVMMPGEDGLSLCRHLRETTEFPVIMLTAKAEEDDQLVGFAFGADDYVTKPFSMKVLLARVAAVVRRPKQSSEDDTVIKAGPVALNVTRYEVSINGKKISPTATEFRILAALLRGKGRVFSRSQLLNQAFGENVIVTDRTIDVHVTALRKKLGSAAKWLQTVRGVGYTFREPTSN